MPYPSKLDAEEIIKMAWKMIDTHGIDHFSMHKLADAFNVKTASLYRYFNRNELLKAVNTLTYRETVVVLSQAAEHTEGDIKTRLVAMALAYRAFVHNHPLTYGMAYNNTQEELRPEPAEAEAGGMQLQRVVSQLTGEENALPALRGIWALIHGYVMLELTGQFRRGGDLDLSFQQAVEAYVDGWDEVRGS